MKKSLGYFKNLKSLRSVCHFSLLVALSLPAAAFASTAASSHQDGSTVVNAKQTQQQTNQHWSDHVRPIISADLVFGYGFSKSDTVSSSPRYANKPTSTNAPTTNSIKEDVPNTAFGGKLRFGLLFYNQNSWAFSGDVGFSALFYSKKTTPEVYMAFAPGEAPEGVAYGGAIDSIEDFRTYDITVGGTVYKSLNKKQAFKAGGTDVFARADAGLRMMTYKYSETYKAYALDGSVVEGDGGTYTSKSYHRETLDVKVGLGIQHNFTDHFSVHGILSYDYGSAKDTDKQADIGMHFLKAGTVELSAGASYIF